MMLITPWKPVTLRSSPVAVSLKSVRPVTIAPHPASETRPMDQVSASSSPVTPEEVAQQVEDHRDGGAADHHVGDDRMHRVAQPAAVQEVLEVLAGRAQRAIHRVRDPGDAIPQAGQWTRPSFDHQTTPLSPFRCRAGCTLAAGNGVPLIRRSVTVG